MSKKSSQESPQPTGIARLLRRASLVTLGMAALLATISPLFISHLGYDGFHGLLWIDSFAAVLKQGVLYPRWLPDSYAGLGSPTFYFYPPLAFYCSSVFRIIGPGLCAQTIYHLLGFIITVLSVWSSYRFVSELTADRTLRIIATLIYGFAPMRAHTLYTRSSLSEHLAFIWVPLVALGLLRLMNASGQKWKPLLLVAFSWAMLLLSHIPTSIVFAITVTVLILVYGWSDPRRMLWPFVGLLLGGLMTAFYLLPVTYYGQFVQLGKLVLDPKGPSDALDAIGTMLHGGNYTDSFISLLGYGGILLVGILLIIEYRRSKVRIRGDHTKLLYALAVSAVLIVFFENASISHLAWKFTHLNQLVQFTWRWNIPALLIVVAAYVLVKTPASRAWLSVLVLVWGLSAMLISSLQIFDVRAHARLAQRTPFDPPEYAPASASSNDTTVIKFALAHAGDPFISSSDAELSWTILEQSPTLIRIAINSGSAAPVVLHHWYWPAWQLQRENAGRVAQKPDSTGRASAVLPSGSYILDYELVQKPIEEAGWIISGVSLVALLGISLRLRSREKAPSTPTRS